MKFLFPILGEGENYTIMGFIICTLYPKYEDIKIKNNGMGIRRSTHGKADKYLRKVSRKMVTTKVHLSDRDVGRCVIGSLGNRV